MNITIQYQCTQCKARFPIDVEFSPFIPAQTWGLPENCSPVEGGEVDEIEPSACEECGIEVSYEKVEEKCYEVQQDIERSQDSDIDQNDED